jgi:predicted  nucleic acid-binding Zn-ribbon protein
VAGINAKYKDYAARVAQWNERAAKVEEMEGVRRERERRSLDRERGELQKQQAELEAERVRIETTSNQAVAAYNDKAKALEARVDSWNQRNAELTARVNAVNNDRETWQSDCAERRYREDDEIAIKRGE